MIILLYADNLKIYAAIENISDHKQLSKNLNKLVEWCNKNGLTLNPAIFNVMSYELKTHPIIFNYVLNGCSVFRPEIFTDLVRSYI